MAAFHSHAELVYFPAPTPPLLIRWCVRSSLRCGLWARVRMAAAGCGPPSHRARIRRQSCSPSNSALGGTASYRSTGVVPSITHQREGRFPNESLGPDKKDGSVECTGVHPHHAFKGTQMGLPAVLLPPPPFLCSFLDKRGLGALEDLPLDRAREQVAQGDAQDARWRPVPGIRVWVGGDAGYGGGGDGDGVPCARRGGGPCLVECGLVVMAVMAVVAARAWWFCGGGWMLRGERTCRAPDDST